MDFVGNGSSCRPNTLYDGLRAGFRCRVVAAEGRLRAQGKKAELDIGVPLVVPEEHRDGVVLLETLLAEAKAELLAYKVSSRHQVRLDGFEPEAALQRQL